MNWWKRATSIIPFSVDDIDTEYETDPYDLADQAESVFQESGIRPDSSKELSHLAIEDGQVIGAVSSGWSNEQGYEEEYVHVFSFDISVKPEFRGKGLVGIKLIQEAIDHYESEKEIYGVKTMMRLWVVNPRLIPILENRYGFDIESSYSNGSAHMVRY